MSLLDRRHWIFDMDGTLTIAVHDFDAIRAELGLPAGRLILEALAELPERERAVLVARLDAIEFELARAARPQPGAARLLAALRERGASLGIVTRNSRENALCTLDAAGLAGFFDPAHVLGRDEAEPKPSPDGILRLLDAWHADAASAVMIGDYRLDLLSGRAAGVATVYLDPSGRFDFATLADHRILHLDDLLLESFSREDGGAPR